jgi:nitrous oxide reductase accessory protein NosL
MRVDRRRFLADTLAAGFVLTPLASLLAACGRNDQWPEGMQPIKWDRDTCVQCSMVISDRRFAAEMCGGPKDTVFKFDDIGCAIFWVRRKTAEHPWMAEAATRLWVADVGSRGDYVRWLDAHRANYLTRSSPMGYNFVAVTHPQPGSVDFATMREHVLAKYK